MVVKEEEASFGSSGMEVVGNDVGALARVLGCGEEGAQMCFCDASGDDHLGFRCNINGESSPELGGVLCFSPDVPAESSSKDNSYTDQAWDCQRTSDISGLDFSSSVENNEYWVVQMGKPVVEVGIEENMVCFYALMLTKILGSERNVQVCICHVSREDFGSCHQIDDQCVLEQAGNDSGWSEINWVYTFATIRLYLTDAKSIVDKTIAGSKSYAYIGYTAEEVLASALKEIDSKRVDGSAQTHCPKYNMALLRPSSHEPPDVG